MALARARAYGASPGQEEAFAKGGVRSVCRTATLQESVRVDQWDVTHACPPGKGGIAKLDFRRTISSLGLSPKKRLNSRLNCDALSYPTSMLAADAVFSFRNISRRA